MDKPKLVDWINILIAFIGVIIIIPSAIRESQETSSDKIERQNRKVGIAQIITGQAGFECQDRLSTSRLIDVLFGEDLEASDDLAINEYLAECNKTESDTVRAKIEAEITQREARILAPDNALVSEANGQSSIDIDSRAIDLLREYTIDIHYLAGKDEEKKAADDIAQKLKRLGLTSETTSVTEDRLRVLGGLSDDQIRYEPDREEQVAVALKRVLDTNYEERQFRLQTIRGTTDNYISIFLKYQP